LLRADDSGVDGAVHDFRPRVARWLAATGAFALTPFALSDLIEGNVLLAAGMLGVVAGLGFGVWLLRRGVYSPPLVVVFFGLPASILNVAAVARFDVYITYWAFVVVMAFHLVLPRRWASVMSTLMIVAAAPVVWVEHGPAIGSRFVVCLSLIAVFGGVTVHMIDHRQRQLLDLMMTDPLTGMFNRRALGPHLDRVERAVTGGSTSILTVDIDRFKSINDRFGHDVGDRVLSGIAAEIRAELRAGAPVFRLGGEEFLVILEDADLAAAEVIAQRVVARVGSHRFLDDHVVTVSIGVAQLRVGEASDGCLRRSDQALYRAKSAGRNTVVTA
jgi:diguanylate cyclase (GGDEF)-like protein